MSATATTPEQSSTPKGRGRVTSAQLRGFGQRWALVGVLALLIVAFSVWKPDEFAQWSNFQSIVNTEPPLIFIALGAIFVLLVGEFDLSLGATLGMSQYVVLLLITSDGFSWPLAIVVALAIGAAIGAVNAFLIVGVGINSFIATIGMASILEGVLSWVSHSSTPIFTGAPQGFQDLAQRELGGIALPVIYAVVVCVVLWVFLEFTVLGREMRASGTNRQAAVLSGLRTTRAITIAFVLGGLLSAAAGVIATARTGSADATSGPSYLLPAYAAAFLGATAVRPGVCNVWGTFIALFVVAVGVVGLQLAGAAAWVTDVFNGGVLLIAVSVSALSARLRGAAHIRRILDARARRRTAGDPQAAGATRT
jgi:ribose transport system permease protein